MLYKVNCEIVMYIKADNFEEVEEKVKNTFNKTDMKFYQILEIEEVKTDGKRR